MSLGCWHGILWLIRQGSAVLLALVFFCFIQSYTILYKTPQEICKNPDDLTINKIYMTSLFSSLLLLYKYNTRTGNIQCKLCSCKWFLKFHTSNYPNNFPFIQFQQTELSMEYSTITYVSHVSKITTTNYSIRII